MAEGGDVGLVLDLMRGKLVGETVTREEGDGDVLAGGRGRMVQDADGRRGLAPRCVDVESRSKVEARQRLDASAANYGDVNGR